MPDLASIAYIWGMFQELAELFLILGTMGHTFRAKATPDSLGVGTLGTHMHLKTLFSVNAIVEMSSITTGLLVNGMMANLVCDGCR